jgi:hypothetical protein
MANTSTNQVLCAVQMPVSVRLSDATSQGYESAEEIPFTAHELKSVLIEQRHTDMVSQAVLPPSPADSQASDDLMCNPSELTKEEERIIRPIDRGTPGDKAIFPDSKTAEQRELARRTSRYYDEVFATRESNISAGERVSRESMVIADIRTNVIVSN